MTVSVVSDDKQLTTQPAVTVRHSAGERREGAVFGKTRNDENRRQKYHENRSVQMSTIEALSATDSLE